MKLTEKQQEMLDYIRDYIKKHGIAPNTTEAALHFDKSRQGCSDMFDRLNEIGAIEYNKFGERYLRIIGDGESVKINLTSPVINVSRGNKSGPKVTAQRETEAPDVAFRSKWLCMPLRKRA